MVITDRPIDILIDRQNKHTKIGKEKKKGIHYLPFTCTLRDLVIVPPDPS